MAWAFSLVAWRDRSVAQCSSLILSGTTSSPSSRSLSRSVWNACTMDLCASTHQPDRIQFGSHPPRLNSIFKTVLVLEQAWVKKFRGSQSIQVLQPVLHSSKEGWGLQPILDLRNLNHSLRRFTFKILTIPLIVSGIKSEGWFITIDLKNSYFHNSILPQHS